MSSTGYAASGSRPANSGATDQIALLRDGSEVVIRRVTPTDAPVLAEGFERLSRESRRLRFLTAKPHLSKGDLKYLTEVDGHNHEALGALDPATGRGLGVARFVRLAPDADVAEVAVTVTDAWQQRGLGTLLLEALTDRARTEGVLRYTALVAGDNTVVIDLLHRMGAHVRDGDAASHDDGDAASQAVEYELDIAKTGLGDSLRAALRAVAGGVMTPPARIVDALAALVPDLLPLGHREPGAPKPPTDGSG
jgi:RimJ/RimL family protein N-acetyltransferase